jgi:hypothetical protein
MFNDLDSEDPVLLVFLVVMAIGFLVLFAAVIAGIN